jgi:hypothetical protein
MTNGNIMPQDDQDSPQYYGFPEHPTSRDIQTWERQEMFLRAYAKTGKICLSAEKIGISDRMVRYWQSSNHFLFQKRLQAAHQRYVELLEGQMDSYIDNMKQGSHLLHMFRLKAEAPEKYREDARIVVQDSSKELLEKLTEMAGKEIEERKRLEGGATEGEYRELDDSKGGQS